MRNVCFTVNNYLPGEAERLLNDVRFSYIVMGFEVGDEGTPHLQGYGELTKQMKFNSVIEIFDKRAHIERRKGTQEQAIIYCKKGGNVIERGVKKDQGARADLDECRRVAAEEGMRAVTRIFNQQGIRVAEKFLTYNEESRDWKPEVIWIYGPTGSGKSRKAREILKDDDVYCKNTGHKWWDGQDGHDAIIIDDFRDSWWCLTYMLALLDRYEFQVECKGGMRQIRARRIVITCLFSPEDMYRGVGEDIQQLLRRIDKVICLVTEVTEVGGNTIAPTGYGFDGELMLKYFNDMMDI